MGVYTNIERFYSIVGTVVKENKTWTLDYYVSYQSEIIGTSKYNLLGDVFVQSLVKQFEIYFRDRKLEDKPGDLTFNEILNCKTNGVKGVYSFCSNNYFSVIDKVLEDTDNFFKYKTMFGDSMESVSWSVLADNYKCCGGNGVVNT